MVARLTPYRTTVIQRAPPADPVATQFGDLERSDDTASDWHDQLIPF